jgi:hypothetical protein
MVAAKIANMKNSPLPKRRWAQRRGLVPHWYPDWAIGQKPSGVSSYNFLYINSFYGAGEGI